MTKQWKVLLGVLWVVFLIIMGAFLGAVFQLLMLQWGWFG